ncbi:MAG: PD40 domain-containing protein [Bacteroidales bacterium]|nr:PD40 domain-containing protein [Bacteroidales bacterium]MBO7463644.1 PD40 domain-containing protein [Bacteroidales bacterium]MBO7568361.1 PD40 domain-containing protein [Bacteroidales bacterium]MBP5683006.1 PD40 domain-containing protein [Bacteroidales bacterium]
MRTSTYILLTTFTLASCGSKQQVTDENSGVSDTITLPAETISILSEPKTDSQKPAHNADNFFAIESDGKVMVGNSTDLLKTTDIKGTDITLSPDGDLIAYTDTTDGHCSVHIYDINTQKDQSLSLGRYNYRSRSFSPDGNYLAVTCQFDEYSCMVILYDMRDSTLTSIVNPDTKALYNPTFSPDGRLISCHDMQKVLIYSFLDGIAKHIKTISCDNLCVDNDLSINPLCKIQFTPEHDFIVYTCADYASEREDFRHLNIYNISNGDILKILPGDKSCKDFEVSDDGNIYFLMESDENQAVACLAKLSDLSPVTISKDIFHNATALRVAY